MSTSWFEDVLALPQGERRDLFEVTAERLGTVASYIEKDLWVCHVLDCLWNRRPDGHPGLVFKGGTSLSKVYDLIGRFSEDIDVVIDRAGLGFAEGDDPTTATDLTNKKRTKLFESLRSASSEYVEGSLQEALRGTVAGPIRLEMDDGDASRQTLLVYYDSLFTDGADGYVAPRVKIEAGARSGVEPLETGTVMPYVADDLPNGGDMSVGGLTVLSPKRTFLEKALILHGLSCGYRDGGRTPKDADRISRHYHDVALMVPTEIGRAAMADEDLLASVREHNLIAFRQAWKKFEEAVPGTIRLVPEGELLAALDRDYDAMQGMTIGDPPSLDWVIEQLGLAEEALNATGPSAAADLSEGP